MDILSNDFEKKWFGIFMFLYFIVMVPFPFFYSTRYIPSIAGLPLFVVKRAKRPVSTSLAELVIHSLATSA
jgi:hypothetical protein